MGFRMMMYVPNELKARMDAAEGVVWSRVACAQLDQFESQQPEDNARRFFSVLVGEEEYDHRDADQWWAGMETRQGVSADTMDDDDFAKAFVRGAVDVWLDVQDKL